MTVTRRCLRPILRRLVLVMVLVQPLAAQVESDPVEDAFRLALLRLSQEGLLGQETVPRVIERPAEKVANFGALVDRDEREGLRVLGTLPGGSAERIGLRTGDLLLAANDTGLRGAGAGERMRALLDRLENGDQVRFEVLRDGHSRFLAGAMEVLELPAVRVELLESGTAAGDPDSTCGRLSTFPVPPRNRQLHPARLLAVDGRLPGPSSQDSFRLAPGRYRLRLAEVIDSREFSAVANRQRSRPGSRDAELELEVRPGVTYLLAARLDPARRGQILDGGYWQPVVWRERSESCR